jgi:two-component system, chemotaxis family, CheB/CheR fusion protein
VDPATAASVPVVGIGASAGGLKALQQLVEAIPKDSGFAYVVIVHLDPNRESRMAQLLQDRTSMPVLQVDGLTAVEPNHVYLIPPGHDLAMRERNIELRDRGERAEHAPIDLFFRTMAESCGGNAVGVVLSGTGADGTAGIRHIREAGGTTIAQSPEEAEYNGMPVSAISTGLIDVVLPSAEIPAEIVRLRSHPARLNDGTAETPDTEAALAQIFGTLRSRTGHDFSLYKRTTVLRRLERRLRFNNVSTLEEYHPVMHASNTESHSLLRDLLISVSSFFRDPEAFEALGEQLPGIFEGKGASDAVRVWVVGCATGEEVYSIAMLLTEYANTLNDPPRLHLFATDIDEHGYAWARAGLYSPSAVAGITPGRLERFFTKEPGGYRIAKSLRELVLFAGHNALHDPPFSRMDVISCRNFFIYLQPEAQERVLETFHFASNPGALLFLGASESVGDSAVFAAIPGTKHRLYRRNSSPYRVTPRPSAADLKPGGSRNTASPHDVRALQFSYGATHLRMLEQYAAASVIVNERLDVVHMSPNAGSFLRLGEGEPNHNLLGLAREDLRRVLRTALHHAFEAGAATTRRVGMTVDGVAQQLYVRVRPSIEEHGGSRFALIVFEVAERDKPVTDGSADPGKANRDGAEAELQKELNRTRDLLESTSSSHDRTVAELQAANEELQSINEEQKAASEELETGREEIQSINEELTTINQEHQSTIEELKRTNGDLQNLIESTEIGTIFLDRSMRVRRFTPATVSIFNFVAADQGRPLAHITHRLKYPSLFEDVAHVLDSLERFECEVESDTGESFIVRINPYRSMDDHNEGAVLTFFDNTAQHRVKNALEEARLIAESANLAKSNFLSTLSHEFRTPLNGILGYADLLDIGDPLTPDQLKKIQRIKAGGWHLAAMIEEILSFAKLDGGHEVVEPVPLDARAIAREAGELIEPTAAYKKLAFIVETPDEPVMLVTDPDKARQILVNICGNAVKYTHAGEIRVSVRKVGKRVLFDITDTGVGIAPEHHQRIFERFWQVSGGTTRAAGGMGIGLSAAREYARLLQGDVEVESVLGVGTTLHFWLPVAYDPR